jgi:hypothetical protein
VTPAERELTVQEEHRIDDALLALEPLPQAQRSLLALRQLLGQRDPEGIGARLEKWTSRGALGWVLDNEADEVSFDARLLGFDVTDFLDDPEVRTPLMMYLFQRIDALADGRRLVVDVDEFWKALGDEAFRSLAQDGLKTYRKRNAMMVFGTQSPSDVLRSPIAPAIVEMCATKIYLPNPHAAARDYVDGFGLTREEFRLIREELTPASRQFLVKQGPQLRRGRAQPRWSGRRTRRALRPHRDGRAAGPCPGRAWRRSRGVAADLPTSSKGEGMRSALLGTMLVALCTAAGPASAQGIPVYDQAGYLQMLEQAKQGIQQLRQMQKQVGEARRLYDSLNALSNVNSIGEALNNPLVRRVVPEDAAEVARVFSSDVSDLGDLERRVDVLREVGRKYTPSAEATEAERYYAQALERSGRRAARDMAIGERVYANADQRLAGWRSCSAPWELRPTRGP